MKVMQRRTILATLIIGYNDIAENGKRILQHYGWEEGIEY